MGFFYVNYDNVVATFGIITWNIKERIIDFVSSKPCRVRQFTLIWELAPRLMRIM